MKKTIFSLILACSLLLPAAFAGLAEATALPFEDDFETGYNADGSDAVPQLWKKWSYVDAKADKDGFLQVHREGNNSFLRLGANRTQSTAASGSDPLIEMGADGIDLQGKTEISFRLKYATATQDQFKVSVKDAAGSFFDLLVVDNNHKVYLFKEELAGYKLEAANGADVALILDAAQHTISLSVNRNLVTTYQYQDRPDFSAAKVRFAGWLWSRDVQVAYDLDNIYIGTPKQTGPVDPPEPGGDGNWTVKQNLINDDFETAYNADGSDAAPQLWKKWSYVDNKSANGGLLQVHKIDGSNVLLMGSDRAEDAASTAADSIIESALLETGGDTQISFRVKPFSAKQNQFSVKAKDANGIFVDIMTIDDKGTIKVFGKELNEKFTNTWTDFKIRFNTNTKLMSVSMNGTETVKDYNFAAGLPAGCNLDQLKIRFGIWIWSKGEKLGYYVDNVSVDQMEQSGEPVEPPEPGGDGDWTVKQNLINDDFETGYNADGSDAAPQLWKKWSYVDNKSANGGLLQVHKIDGSNVLLMGSDRAADAASTAADALIESALLDTKGDSQISFRLKPQGAKQNQFNVKAKDANGVFFDLVNVDDKGNMKVFGKELSQKLSGQWMEFKIRFNTERKTMSLLLNETQVETDYNFASAVPAGFDLSAMKIRFGIWIWAKGERLGYYVDDISVDQVEKSGGTIDPPEPGDETWTVKQNLISDDFETGYNADGSDAAPQLWKKWSYVDNKSANGGLLQVHKAEGTNVLLLGGDRGAGETSTAADPLIEAGELDTKGDTQISFRLKPYGNTQNQFTIKTKDSNGTFYTLLETNDKGVIQIFGKELEQKLDNSWVTFCVRFNTEQKTVTVSINGTEVLKDYGFASALPSGYLLDSLKVRFGTWLWTKGEKVGYYVDDISVDQMEKSGGTIDPPEEDDWTVKQNLINDDFEMGYNADGSDAAPQLWKKWNYVDNKSAKGGILEVHQTGGSNALLIGANRGAAEASDGADPLIEIGELDTKGDTQISFRLKPYSNNQNQFSIKTKDANGAFLDLMTINDKGVMTVFGKQVASTLGNDWTDIKIRFNTEKKTVTLYVNQEEALTDYGFSAALPAGYNLDSLKVRFGGWLWTKGEKVGYFVDDISIDQMQKGGEQPPDPEEELTVKANLAKDDFETGYNADGSDAAPQLWKNWTYVDNKNAKGGVLEVHGQDGSNTLLIGSNRGAAEASDGADPLIESAALDTKGITQIAFRLKAYSNTKNQFTVKTKDSAGVFYDLMTINDKGVVTVFGKQIDYTFSSSWADFKIQFDTDAKTMSVYADGNLVESSYNFATSLPAGYDLESLKVRFGGWLWTKGEKLGYFIDDISIDQMQKGGEQPPEPQEPKVTITSPANGARFGIQEITLAATVTAPNQETFQKVEFLVDGAAAGDAFSAPYQCTWMPPANGTYTVTAKAYETDGTQYLSDPVSITIADLISKVIASYDFSGYNGSQGYETMAGWTLVENNNNAKFYVEAVDDGHPHALLVKTSNPNTNYGGGYAQAAIQAAQMSGRFFIEGDFYFDTPDGKDIALFNLKSDSAQWNKTLVVSRGSLQYLYKDASGADKFERVATVQDKTWMHIKAEYDLFEKSYDLYLDGVKILDGQAMYNQEIKPTEGMTYRFTLDTLGSAGAFALDNIRVVMFYEPPAVDKLTFQTAAGEFTQTQNVPYDASAVVLAFNQAMSEALMNGENIWLENAAGVKVGTTGAYDAAAYTYSIKPAKQLLPSMGYRICLSGKLTSALSGVAMGEAVQYGFTTKGKGIYMEAGAFTAGGKEVTQAAQLKAGDKVKCRIEVANESGAEKTLTLRFAVYKANQLVGITAKTAVVPANGGSLETGELILPSNSLQDVVLRAYLCDGFRPVGIEKELK